MSEKHPCQPANKSNLKLTHLAAAISFLVSPFMLEAAEAPVVMKAKTFDTKTFESALLSESTLLQSKISDYYVSEKLDGIRAFWNGKQLVTRTGNIITAPAWFTAALPDNITLDGELWAGRGNFQQVASTVMDDSPNETQWKKIKYMVFDLPSDNRRFELRLKQLTTLINDIDRSHIQLISQHYFESLAELSAYQEHISQSNGEGLMLHHKNNLYKDGRSDSLLKLKPYQDSEAVVVGYEEGKGKYLGKMGAIWVLTPDNKKFKIGSGFSDAERANPPALGAVINYRHNGYTKSGIPRFARFIRVRSSPEI